MIEDPPEYVVPSDPEMVRVGEFFSLWGLLAVEVSAVVSLVLLKAFGFIS